MNQETTQVKRRNMKRFNMVRQLINVGIRIVFFLMFPAVFSTTFSGVKYICSQFATGKMLTINSFVITLIAVLVFTMVFGRFFCGFACAFGSYGDLLNLISSSIRRKMKKRPIHFPKRAREVFRYGKYVVLVAVIILAFTGSASLISELSPWVPFSQLIAYQLPREGGIYAIIILALISVGMLFEPRFFCRYLCPLGAIFSLLPVIPISSVKRDRDNCIKGCNRCEQVCPCSLEIPDRSNDENQKMGECFQCGNCVNWCPKGHTKVTTMPGQTAGIVWQLVKAGLLFALCWWLVHLSV